VFLPLVQNSSVFFASKKIVGHLILLVCKVVAKYNCQRQWIY
jgi:hypothetical protein